MNKTHRVVWSDARQSYIVAHENGAFGGCPGTTLALSLALLLGMPAHAAPGATELPTGGNVVAGSATIGTAGARMDIRQTTQRAAIDWNTFNIGGAAHVHFAQPAGGAALNRVLDTNASQIYGRLTSTGQVFLVNPNGVFFAPGAQVDVGGLVASTLIISNADFMAGNYRFEGASSNAIINQGNITAHGDGSGGTIALIAARITNDGNLAANGGNVLLGAGSRVTLDMGGPVKIQVEQGTLDALIEQGGAIRADGGLVHLSARAANDLVTATINHTGITDASSLTARGGRIVLEGDDITLASGSRLDATGATGGGEALVGGGWQGSGDMRQATTVTMEQGVTIDVSATKVGAGGTAVLWSDVTNAVSQTRAYGTIWAKGGVESGDGGRIETSGHWLDIAGSQGGASATKGKAGEWLLDPYNVTITSANASGAWGGGNPDIWTPSADNSTILNTDINSKLEGGTNVTVTTTGAGSQIGDITVASAITKASGNSDVTLTLNAANSIIVDQAISNTGGSGKLHVVLDADNNSGTGDGAGIVLLNANITTGGGNLSFGTGRTATIGGVSTLVGGDVYVAGAGARTLSTGGGNVTVNGEMIVANTDGLTINTSNGNVSFGGLLNSGNSYASVSSVSDWAAALAAAASGGGSGVGDTYLATITSRLENAIASRTVNYNPSWLGARRVTGIGTNAVWRWVAGPEGLQDSGNGLPFFTQNGSDVTNGSGGTAISGRYSNWNPGEPNNYNGANLTAENESALQFVGTTGQWNDLPKTGNTLNYYVKETNMAASPVTVNAGIGTVTFSGAVGTSKALSSLNVTAGTIAINGGAVTTEGLQTYTGNVTLGSSATTLTQTNANTDFTLWNGRSISNATAADATLTIKTTGAIILKNDSSISSSTGKLNSVLWADNDGDASGYIQAGNDSGNATISTNGGHLWMGGGSGSTTWNGLTVGSANAFGNATAADGIYLYNAGINTNGGNIAMYGEGRNGAAACGGSSSCTSDGIKFRGANSVDSGAGSIYMYGKATLNSSNSANGIELGHPGETTNTITSSSSAADAITLEGYATGASATNSWGVYTWATTIAATSGGGITLKGSGAKNAGVTVASGGAVLANSGKIILQGTGYGATTPYAVLIEGNVGQKSGSSVTASTSDIDIIGDTLSVTGAVQASGNLTVRPNTGSTTIGIAGGTGTLALPASYFSTNFVNGFSGITVGSTTAGSMTIAGATTYSDNLTLKTAGDIVMNASSNLTGQSGQSASLVLWSDSDATGGGAIVLNSGSGISSNGGHLWMGGGTQSDTAWNGLTVGNGYATGGTGLAALDGIRINNATLNSAGGDIAFYGKSAATNGNTAGIRINDSTSGAARTLIDSGTGTILLDGISQGMQYVAGIEFNTSNNAATATITSANTTANAITLHADARPATVAGWGLLSYYGTTISATGSGGGISITGAINNSGGKAIGFHSPGKTGTSVLANGGPVIFNAITDGVGDSLYAVGNGMAVGQLAGSAVTSSSSDITLNIDRNMTGSVAGVPELVFNSSGTLTVQPRTAGTSIGIAGGTGTLALPASYFSTNFIDGFSGITVGKSDAGAITVGGATTFNDSTTLLTNSTIAINGAVTANENLALTSNGAVTQSQAVGVTGTTTIAAGANDVTLTNASNNFTGAVSVVSAQNLAMTDSNAMTFGAVNATGTVDVATLTNDLTLTGAISTSNTSASAVTLNAGKNTAAGTATGGNILVSGGSVSVGSGGRATLYSGSVSGSTGLTTLIGSGSGRFRYNSDESATNYTTALGSGNYAIYREQPTISVAPASTSIVYGGSLPTYTASYGSLVNGDSDAGITGTTSWTTAPGTTSSSGHRIVGGYDVSYSGGLASGLGYGFADNTGSTGELTVTAKTLTVGYTGVNRVYDGTTDATVTTGDDRVSGDTLTINRTAAFADKNAATGKTVNVSGVSLSGTDAGNYTVSATGSATADISAKVLNLTGSRIYDGTTGVAASIFTINTGISGESLTLAGSGTIADKNVGTGKAVTLGSLALGDGAGGSAGNYTLSGGTHKTDITANMATLLDPIVNQLIREQLPPQTTVTSLQAGEQASTLEMVEVTGKDPNIQAILDNNNGRGFMRVFVVDGGIHLPEEMINMEYGDVHNKENP